MKYLISIKKWNLLIEGLIKKNNLIYAPVEKDNSTIDFDIITNPDEIIYNSYRTITPLKHFLFPVKENVSKDTVNRNIILIGAKNCDLIGLDLLEKVFLDSDYIDPFYEARKNHLLIIGTDCYDVYDTCHCVSTGINPYPEKNCDLIVNKVDEKIIVETLTSKGEKFIDKINDKDEIEESNSLLRKIKNLRKKIVNKIKNNNKKLPDNKTIGKVIAKSFNKKGERVWKEYANFCVSCGACVINCPTCHCFLLIDSPVRKNAMEKIKSYDACQFPGFEKVAAGVDPLGEHYIRFRNRYVCKYINRPKKYDVIACTGCGRCTDVCIGKINKNEVILSLMK